MFCYLRGAMYWNAGKPFESGNHYWEDTVSCWIEIETFKWGNFISGTGRWGANTLSLF